jgi:hypothetical protein
MNLIIKGGLIALFLALPSLANATFFKPPQQGLDLEDLSFMDWHREGAEKVSLLPLLKQLFEPGRERAGWLNFLPVKKGDWSKPKFSFTHFGHHFGFRPGGKWHHGHWPKHHTEVPVPAALPLFSLALFSLGLFKRRR